MSAPIYHDTVSSMDDVVLRYINHLLLEHARDQAMLQSPPEEHLLEFLREVRAKNTELEQRNRELRLELDQALHEREDCRNANAALMRQNDDLLFKNKRYAAEQAAMVAGVDKPYAAPRTKAEGIDGEAAIAEGRAALDLYNRAARQPDRGE